MSASKDTQNQIYYFLKGKESMMKIQKSRIEQLNEIMALYSGARLFMKQHGNPDQWGEHYPEESMIRMDIEAGDSYVCI